MLIVNGTIITLDAEGRIISDGAIYIVDGHIAEIGTTRELVTRYPGETTLDAKGQYVMPGNICAHTHFYGAYARGLAIPGAPPKDFPEILSHLWWNLDKALDPDSVRMSAFVSLVDAIKHGTTTLIDHHASPNFIGNSLNVLANMIDRAGLRAVLCYEVSDRDGKTKRDASIAENMRFIRQNGARPRVRGTFGLHASMTLSDATLRACADAHPNGGFHIHVAEHEADETDSLAKYGKRVIQRLDAFGMLHDKTLLAHCVHVDSAEMDIIAERGAWVTHQPRSNMNNAVGAMPLEAMYARGIKLCLGNDGFSNAMWDEWKAGYFLHKVVGRDPRLANGAHVAEMAWHNNARLVERFFGDLTLGQLIPGAAADMIFVDYAPFTPMTAGNLPWHVIFGFQSSMVTMTMVDGVILMQDRQLKTLDERAIADEAMALAPGVWERYMHYASEPIQSKGLK